MQHRPRSGPFAQQHGENLFWASPVMWSDGRREVQQITSADVVDAWDEEKQWYDNAIEKIDFVLELLPYHLDPDKLPSDVIELIYKFDSKSVRWRLNFANSKEKKYTFRGDVWISTN